MKFCVIGVGRFGYHVAVTLAENGMEVLAIDANETIIASIKDKVTQAICLRITDEESLRSVGVEDMDTVIVAMGENFAQSILVTALLKRRLHIKTIITRSISDIHRDILLLIGADQVVLPEREEGRRVADILSLPFNAVTRLAANFCISRLEAPREFVKKSIKELDFPNTYGIICIGKKEDDRIEPIDPEYLITEQDVLLFAGTIKDLSRLPKSVGSR
jgi:trk system potassium uptake protein TrkA